MVCRTFASRGKSFTPESRIEMLEERRALEERSEATHEASGLAILLAFYELRIQFCDEYEALFTDGLESGQKCRLCVHFFGRIFPLFVLRLTHLRRPGFLSASPPSKI